MSLAAQAQRRRTLAIISHADAGKTPLTEKLPVLLFPHQWTLHFSKEKNAELPLFDRATLAESDRVGVPVGRRKRGTPNVR